MRECCTLHDVWATYAWYKKLRAGGGRSSLCLSWSTFELVMLLHFFYMRRNLDQTKQVRPERRMLRGLLGA